MAWTTPITWVGGALQYLFDYDLNAQIKGNTTFLKSRIAWDAAEALTIGTGEITPSWDSSYLKLAGEGATDDELDTINGGAEGDVIIIRPNGNDITLKNGTGNLNLGADIVLSADTQHVMLICDASGNWQRMLMPSAVRHANAMELIDLSGSAASSVILHPGQNCTMARARLVYLEASSADAGITVTIGKPGDDSYYFTGDSTPNQAQFDFDELALLNNDIAADDTIFINSAGGKVGTGVILCCIEYEVN